MIALAYIFFFMVYCTVSFCIILLGYRFAKKYFQKGWTGGLIAGLVMYNLVFWDLIPVLIMHKHYCATQAGYWEYQSPEEWVEKHPEVWGQDWSDQSKWKREIVDPSYENPITKIWISPKIFIENIRVRNFSHAINKYENTLIDSDSGGLISRAVEFEVGTRTIFTAGSNIKGISIWQLVSGPSCGIDKMAGYGREFSKYSQKLIDTLKNKGINND